VTVFRGALACGAIAVTLGSLAAAQASAQSQGPGLRYFGYFAARITASGGDHLAEVRDRSNLNWVQISDPDRYVPEVLDGCKPRGCIISTGHEFFRGCDSVHSPSCELHPEYAARWARLAEAVRSRINRVGAFYLLDEPQWRGATPAELHTAATTIKATYPDIPVMMVEAGPQVSSSLQVPSSVDWVGFDWYCRPFSDVQRTLATLSSRTSASQSLFLVPESAPLQACGGAPGHATDAEIAPLQYEYLQLAVSNPRVIGLLAFGFWTSGYGSAQLPLTVSAHRDIYGRIAGKPVKFARRAARIASRGRVKVRLRCPAVNIRWCAGKLSLRHRGSRLGAAAFEFAPGAAATVRVRVRRGKRRSIRGAARSGGVKLRARAKTDSGRAKRTIRLRS
jgi:hypothetical protein